MKITKTRSRQAKKIALTVIVAAAVVVAGSLWANQYFSPAGRASRELHALAKDYYENFFYDLLLRENSNDADLEKIFEPYVKHGMQPVLLRQLLLFDDSRHESSRKEFVNDSYKCDTNTTFVKITPVPPFGRTDWEAEYNLSCVNS